MTSRGGDERLGLAHVIGGLHIGNGHRVHAQLQAVGQVFFVLIGEGAHLGGLAGQGQALARSHQAGVVGLQQNQTIGTTLPHNKLQAAVSQHHAVARFQTFQNDFVIKGQIGQLVHTPGAGAQQKLHALVDLDGVFRHDAQTDFGAGKILHDGDGPSQFLFNFADMVNDIHEI